MEDFIELLTELNDACSNHDWTYMYSDDHRAWTKGNNESARISSLLAELKTHGLEDKANEIYVKHRPAMFHEDLG